MSKSKSSLKERLAKQREDLKSSRGGGNFFTIKEGTTRFRHLYAGPENDFAAEAVFFYLGQDIKGVISPHTFGGKCAIMEAYNELSASKDPDERELAKKFKPQKKFFVPSIRYKDDKGKEIDTEMGVKLLLLTQGSYQALLDLYLDDDNGDFTDPVNGYDVKYRRTGKTKTDTEYSVLPGKPSKIGKEYRGPYNPEEMLKALTPTYKETKALLERFMNLPQEKEEAEDEAPKKKSKKKKSKKDL